MADLITGDRFGQFLVLVDSDGRRHAVRQTSILGLHDGDESQTSTLVTLPGGKKALVEVPLEQVLGWLSYEVRPQAPKSAPGRNRRPLQTAAPAPTAWAAG